MGIFSLSLAKIPCWESEGIWLKRFISLVCQLFVYKDNPQLTSGTEDFARRFSEKRFEPDRDTLLHFCNSTPKSIIFAYFQKTYSYRDCPKFL